MSSQSDSLRENIEVVRGRPIPKDFLTMFNISYSNRLFVTVVDKNDTWQDDLVIGERIFGNIAVMPVGMSQTDLDSAWDQTLDVLKQRMKYPGVKDDPKLLQLAKTWVLPTKLHKISQNDTVLSMSVNDFSLTFRNLFTQLKIEEEKVHVLKIELANGLERQFVYKFLDAGFRPSIILVKWTEDLDEHVATAHCGGHLANSGYSLVGMEGSYALYLFTDQVLYDICSVKQVGLKNPFMDSLLQSLSVHAVPRTAFEEPPVETASEDQPQTSANQ